MGWLIPLDVYGLTLARNFDLIYHKQKFFTPAMQNLINLAHERQGRGRMPFCPLRAGQQV